MTEHNHASVILSLANRFSDFLDRGSRSKSWPFVVFFIAIGISLFSWMPNYRGVSGFIKTPYGAAKTWWLDHPFKVVPVEQFFPVSERHIGYNAGIASHLDKMTYRAFLPLLNQVAPFGIWTLVAACHLGVLTILWFSYRIVASQVGDNVSGALACWAVSTSFAGQWGFHDYSFGDAAAVGMLLGAMFSRQAVWTCLLILMASFTDERACTAAPLVLLFHYLRDYDRETSGDSNASFVRDVIRKGWPIMVGILAYLSIRLTATFLTDARSGSSMLASVDVLRGHLYSDYPNLVFKVFEFLWILPFFFLVEFRQKTPSANFIQILFGLGLALAAFPAMVVWDIDRSLFYLLPGVILAICFMPVSLKNLRLLLLAIFFANVIWLYPSSSGLRAV
jgi:hypothetical protein